MRNQREHADQTRTIPSCREVGHGEALTFEQYAAVHGASRQDFGDAGNHRRGERHSDKTWARVLRVQCEKDADLYRRRAALREEYAGKVRQGVITAPTARERYMAIAMGHPDLASTQAARRLVEKRWAGAGLGGDDELPSTSAPFATPLRDDHRGDAA